MGLYPIPAPNSRFDLAFDARNRMGGAQDSTLRQIQFLLIFLHRFHKIKEKTCNVHPPALFGCAYYAVSSLTNGARA